MCTCICTRTHAHLYINMYICIYLCIYLFILFIHVCSHLVIHWLNSCMHAYILYTWYVSTCICTCVQEDTRWTSQLKSPRGGTGITEQHLLQVVGSVKMCQVCPTRANHLLCGFSPSKSPTSGASSPPPEQTDQKDVQWSLKSSLTLLRCMLHEDPIRNYMKTWGGHPHFFCRSESCDLGVPWCTLPLGNTIFSSNHWVQAAVRTSPDFAIGTSQWTVKWWVLYSRGHGNTTKPLGIGGWARKYQENWRNTLYSDLCWNHWSKWLQ